MVVPNVFINWPYFFIFVTTLYNLKLNAEECKQRDVISFTVIISEMKDGMEIDRRGVSTVIHIV